MDNKYNIIVSSLSKIDEVECIYINNKYDFNKKIINCNIVCNVDNITNNIDVYKNVIANCEIIKALLKRANIQFNYSIISNVFYEEMEDMNSDTYKEYYISNIIYTKKKDIKRY